MDRLCFWAWFGLVALGCSSGTSGGGGGGAGGGGATGNTPTCAQACAHVQSSGCGNPDCEASCQQAQQQFAQEGCSAEYGAYLQCSVNAPVDCSGANSTQPACDTALHSLGDCLTCGPATGPKPGDTCSAADEGKVLCWGCQGVIDCRYGDGVFLWRLKEDCKAIDSSYQCTFDPQFDTEPYCSGGV